LQKASNANYDTTWSTITGTLVYQGSWNAATNTPTLTSSVGTNGYYYVVGTSGSTNLNGITDWVVGDWAIFNGSVWQKIDNTDLVSSVNGQTGVVVLDAADVGALAITNNLSDLANGPTARTNLGLGSIATQDASNVAITGGTINNTTIGATTPSTGVFTTLTATGQTDVGGSSALTMRFTTTSSTVMRAAAVGASVAEIRWSVPSFHTFYTGSNATLSSEGASQLRVSHTASAVNYVQVTGAATGGAVAVTAQGSDTNVQLTLQSKGAGTVNLIDGSNSTGLRVTRATAGGDTFLDVQRNVGLVELKAASGVTNGAFLVQSKGTGAIDLAAGSRGVNISNGGTVTAITRTVNGTGYTSIPALAISAPTTAGGVQATATPTMLTVGQTVVSGGSGYTVGDSLTIVGGTFTTPVILTVSTVSAGAVTGVTVLSGGFGNYSILPSTPASVTGGTGSGATFNLTWALAPTFTITNAGSGYVEQPTVTFSGGGGSGAAAYATVGSGTVIRSLGNTGAQSIDFQGPSSINTGVPNFRVRDSGANSFVMAGGATDTATLVAQGATNVVLTLASNGTQSVRIGTNGSSAVEQLRVSHTASAVNYVQVTGAATGASPSISAQGSDTNLNLNLQVKGTGAVSLAQNRTNYISAFGAGTGGSPSFLAQGTDTNIDLTLTPKGTGNVRFGTYTGTILTPTGYVEIKDSGGTVRRLLVG
jgi:hypothetical protein